VNTPERQPAAPGGPPPAPLLLAAFALAAALALGSWWWLGRPATPPEAPAGRLDCVSYSPPTERPLASVGVSRAEIERDLGLLAERFRCVRVYSVSDGLGEVPAVARRQGLKVLLGFWIGRDPIHNRKEIEAGLAIANRYRDVVEAIIVGNEVLLRRELTGAELAGLIREVNDATDLPVTYADVWDFWIENPSIEPTVDFVTVHLLPYWENEPTGIEAAIAHAAGVYGEAQRLFPGKRIFIGETGWPSRGRQREEATPGRIQQAHFIREFVAWATSNGVSYNLIEAFDQPWKRGQEGTVGGYWCLYDAGGAVKFPLQGPLVEEPRWLTGFIAAATGGGLAALLWLLWPAQRQRPARSPGAATAAFAMMLLAGIAGGATAALQWRYLLPANRSWIEWAASGGTTAIGWLLFVGLCLRFAALLRSGDALPEPGGIAEALRSLNSRHPVPSSSRAVARGIAGVLRFLLLVALAYIVLGLVFDSRYRDFPTSLFALPVLALVLNTALQGGLRTARRRIAEERLLAAGIVAGAVLIPVLEGPYNRSAWGFSLLAALGGASLLYRARRESRDDEHPEQHADHG